MHICMVCGFDKLDEPQYIDDSPSFNICQCCGFQAGYDDLDQGKTFEEYRREWISEGAEWFKEGEKPLFWSLASQLKNIGIEL